MSHLPSNNLPPNGKFCFIIPYNFDEDFFEISFDLINNIPRFLSFIYYFIHIFKLVGATNFDKIFV